MRHIDFEKSVLLVEISLVNTTICTQLQRYSPAVAGDLTGLWLDENVDPIAELIVVIFIIPVGTFGVCDPNQNAFIQFWLLFKTDCGQRLG